MYRVVKVLSLVNFKTYVITRTFFFPFLFNMSLVSVFIIATLCITVYPHLSFSIYDLPKCSVHFFVILNKPTYKQGAIFLDFFACN